MDSCLVSTDKIDHAQVSSMFQMMQEYYENVDYSRFVDDLKSKDFVIMITSDNKLCGFSSQVLLQEEFEGKSIQVLFSGDTIIAKKHRNSLALPVAWGRMMLSFLKNEPRKPLYWLLTSKGYRTYKFLPVFFKKYYPNPESIVPSFERGLVKFICSKQFQNKFDTKKMVLRAETGAQCLKATEEEKHSALNKKEPNQAFFENLNPGYIKGDELVCIVPFYKENLKPYILKQLER